MLSANTQKGPPLVAWTIPPVPPNPLHPPPNTRPKVSVWYFVAFTILTAFIIISLFVGGESGKG